MPEAAGVSGPVTPTPWTMQRGAMEQRAAKQQRIDEGHSPALARLQKVANVKSTSNLALQNIMKIMEGSAPNKRALSDARQARFSSIYTTLPLEVEADGSVWQWPLCHPGHLLTRMVAESPTLQAAFAGALQKFPCSQDAPWSLMVGFDEFVPGNKLRLQNHRKSMNLSFPFEQLGSCVRCVLGTVGSCAFFGTSRLCIPLQRYQDKHVTTKGSAVSSDIVWFTPVAVRAERMHEVDKRPNPIGMRDHSLISMNISQVLRLSSVVLTWSAMPIGVGGEVAVGWSRMLRDYLRLQLLAPDAGLQSTGVPLDLGGGRFVVIWARLGTLLSDGDGLRIALQWAGQGGVKPCFRHYNVLRKNSGRAEFDEGYVEIACHDATKFKAWPEAELHATMDMLVEARAKWLSGDIPKVRLETLQTAFGFRPTPEGLLCCASLRPVVSFTSVMRYDWVHTLLSDGVLTTEAWRLIEQSEREHLGGQANLMEFLKQEWRIPKHRQHQGRLLNRIFDAHSARANEEAGKLKCSASELITLYGMLRHWAETRLPLDDERIKKHAHVCFMACVAVDVIMLAKRGDMSPADAGATLRVALSAHLEAHKALHGTDHVRPKHHWTFDLCEQLEQDKRVHDTFIIERLHLRVRAVAEHCKNLAHYETSVLSGVVNDHCRRCQAASFAHCRMGKHALSLGWAPQLCLTLWKLTA